MNAAGEIVPNRQQKGRSIEKLRRAFSDFLTIPLVVVLVFLALGLAAYAVDTAAGPREEWGPVWTLLDRYVGDAASATGLLETIAGSLITVTSITFSILLLAVQQGAASLTSQISDQYLRRVSNQILFGFFVGASLYTLETLVLVNDGYRPVIGVTLAIIITAAALSALVLLIYSTIKQTKSATIIETIHHASLKARTAQQDWLLRTSEPRERSAGGLVVASESNGHLARIDIARLEKIAHEGAGCTIELSVSLGGYVTCGGALAIIRSAQGISQDTIKVVRAALVVEEQRNLGSDAGLGVSQLANIGWTATSTAKSNPSAAGHACQALHNLLWYWAHDGTLDPERQAGAPILYKDDLADQLMDGFESITVAGSESMMNQSLAAVMEALTASFAALPPRWKNRVEDVFLTSLASLGDHAPTRILQVRFSEAAEVLSADGRHEAAASMRRAWDKLASTKREDPFTGIARVAFIARIAIAPPRRASIADGLNDRDCPSSEHLKQRRSAHLPSGSRRSAEITHQSHMCANRRLVHVRRTAPASDEHFSAAIGMARTGTSNRS